MSENCLQSGKYLIFMRIKKGTLLATKSFASLSYNYILKETFSIRIYLYDYSKKMMVYLSQIYDMCVYFSELIVLKTYILG